MKVLLETQTQQDVHIYKCPSLYKYVIDLQTKLLSHHRQHSMIQ